MAEIAFSEIVGLAGLGVRMMKDAYRNAAKHLGKKKARALLSAAIREMLTTNPDLGRAWGNILKWEKLVGREDIDNIKARSIFKKVKGFQAVRVGKAKAKTTGLRLRNVTPVIAHVPPKTFKSATSVCIFSPSRPGKSTPKKRKRRKK